MNNTIEDGEDYENNMEETHKTFPVVPVVPVEICIPENELTPIVIPSPKIKTMMICIPCVEDKISNKFIFRVFCNLQIGFIESISEYPVKHKEFYKRIVIRVKLNKSDLAKYIQTRFDEGKNIKIVYSMPWYWICVLCRENSSPRIR